MKKLVEQTIISKASLVFIGVTITIFAVMTFSLLYSWYHLGRIVAPINLLFLLVVLVALLERSSGRYIYEVDNRTLKVTKLGLFGKRTYEVSLKSIVGIYRYKAQLVGYLKFRRTFRLHSALDKRAVWTIAYQLQDKAGKDINQRIYAKFSPEMLEFLAILIPGKVMVPEKKVIAEVISREDPD